MRHKILPGLTTTPRSNWREKIKEINKFGIKEIALFPTFLEMSERKELYKLLEKTKLRKIPHAHLRSDDMEEWELDFLHENYETKLFNMHFSRACIDFMLKSKYRKNIFLENLNNLNELYFENISKCGGICLDVSHWNAAIFFKKKSYNLMRQILKKYKIGCCHISAESKKPYYYVDPKNGKKTLVMDDHWLSDLSQLDYVKKYVKYLPEYISIELENPFEEQLKIKKYLEKIIK